MQVAALWQVRRVVRVRVLGILSPTPCFAVGFWGLGFVVFVLKLQGSEFKGQGFGVEDLGLHPAPNKLHSNPDRDYKLTSHPESL